MTILHLIMPEKLKNITVKIVKAPYRVGDDVYCDVRIFGDLQRNTFRMKITKTLWHSLYDQLVARFELGGDADESIDKDLNCIVGKMITVYGIPDINRAYETKDGNVDSPKIFKVDIREDLEEAEKIGGEVFNVAVDRQLTNNIACWDCVVANLELADEDVKKEKEREEKKKKRQEVSKYMKKLDDPKDNKEIETLWS